MTYNSLYRYHKCFTNLLKNIISKNLKILLLGDFKNMVIEYLKKKKKIAIRNKWWKIEKANKERLKKGWRKNIIISAKKSKEIMS